MINDDVLHLTLRSWLPWYCAEPVRLGTIHPVPDCAIHYDTFILDFFANGNPEYLTAPKTKPLQLIVNAIECSVRTIRGCF